MFFSKNIFRIKRKYISFFILGFILLATALAVIISQYQTSTQSKAAEMSNTVCEQIKCTNLNKRECNTNFYNTYCYEHDTLGTNNQCRARDSYRKTKNDKNYAYYNCKNGTDCSLNVQCKSKFCNVETGKCDDYIPPPPSTDIGWGDSCNGLNDDHTCVSGTTCSSGSGWGKCLKPPNSVDPTKSCRATSECKGSATCVGNKCTGGGSTSDTSGTNDGKESSTTVNAPAATTVRYTLKIVKSGTGAGTVTSSPAGINCGTDCSQSILKDTKVTLTAKPSTGSKFMGWSGYGGCSGGSKTPSCTLSMVRTDDVGAIFDTTAAPVRYALTIKKTGTGTGTVTSSPAGINCGTTCSQSILKDTRVTLTANPSAGSKFEGWGGFGGCSGGSKAPSCTLSMVRADDVSAKFDTTTPITPPITITITPDGTSLSLNVLMHGIGASGDNTNPLFSTASNKDPKTKTRNIEVSIFDPSDDKLITTETGNITYDNASGSFKGTIALADKITTTGKYYIKIKSPTHLTRKTTEIQIELGKSTTVPDVSLIAGDIVGDPNSSEPSIRDSYNKLDALDYSRLLGCISDLSPAVSCTAENKKLADLNDDGSVNQLDLNLYLREIAIVQAGDN